MTGTAHEPVVFDCSGQGEPPYAEDTLTQDIKQTERKSQEALDADQIHDKRFRSKKKIDGTGGTGPLPPSSHAGHRRGSEAHRGKELRGGWPTRTMETIREIEARWRQAADGQRHIAAIHDRGCR